MTELTVDKSRGTMKERDTRDEICLLRGLSKATPGA